MNIGPILGLLLVGNVCDDADPARGGFFAGISGMAKGCYEQRLDEREQAVREREQRLDALEAERLSLQARSADAAEELEQLRREHLELKRMIIQINSDIAARQIKLDGATQSHVQAALTRQAETAPEAPGASDADRIDSLRAAIEDARALVDKLSSL